MLDLTRLRFLMAVGEAGSISGAARSLRYTAAAVSQQLSKLERETGLTLVVRHPYGVRLTPPGEALVDAAREVVQRLALAENRARELDGMEAPKLRVASFQSASAGLLPQILTPLCQRFPRMGLEFVQVPRDEALHLVRTHDADVALVHEHPEIPGDIHQPGHTTDFLFADVLRLVSAPNHPAARWDEPVGLDRLDGQALIVGRPEDDDRQVIDGLFAELGVAAVQVAEVGEYFIAAAMASSGIAVTLMPELAVPAGYPLVRKRLRPHLERHVYLATRTGDDSLAVSTFRQTAFRVLQKS